MPKKSLHQKFTLKELLFQLLVSSIVFISFAVSLRHPQVSTYEVIYFGMYLIVASVINYVLIPKFLYTSKIPQFVFLLLLSILFVIVFEEFVLEKVFFPDTRGQYFKGFFLNFLHVLPRLALLVSAKVGWDALQKEKQLDQLHQAVKESELNFLKSQINPHFLFNNLNNLYAYAIENSPKTPEIILELSSVLRYMLYECKAEYVRLDKEITHMENFVRLSRMQIEEKGTVRFSTDNIQPNYFIAPLILIVFIENAFKHSAASQANDIEINIHISLEDNGMLHFLCENSYLPQKNNESLSQGIGLKNVRKRLNLLYPNAHQLTIDDENNFYRVNLALQLTEKI